jgi:predicted solute-binding protein
MLQELETTKSALADANTQLDATNLKLHDTEHQLRWIRFDLERSHETTIEQVARISQLEQKLKQKEKDAVENDKAQVKLE